MTMAGARVTNNLPQFEASVRQRAARGMTQALVLGGSELAVLVPVASSTLLNSKFQRVEVDADRVVGTVGFTAEYAAAVHEAEGKLKGLNVRRPKVGGKDQGFVWGPHDGQPQFLRLSFERAEPNIRRVLSGAIRT